MKNLKNILLYILIVILFTIFTVGIGGGFSSPESNLAAYICGSFWGIIWLPVLTSRDNWAKCTNCSIVTPQAPKGRGVTY